MNPEWLQAKDQLHNFMQKFQRNANQHAWVSNTYGDNCNFGCSDEFWHEVNPHSGEEQKIRAVKERLKKDGDADLHVEDLDSSEIEIVQGVDTNLAGGSFELVNDLHADEKLEGLIQLQQ